MSSRKEYESLEKRHSGKTKHFASYEYEVDGEICVYNGYFKNKIPPETITLYYKNNPHKPFCMKDYQWNPLGGIVYLFFILIPFLLAGFTAIALGIPLYEKTDATQEERVYTAETGLYESDNSIKAYFNLLKEYK